MNTTLTPPHKPEFEFSLVLRPCAGNWRTSPEQRLRIALKVLLRAFGLRCTTCRPVPIAKPEVAP